MRYQGKITRWKDDQGFGFIAPNGGGEPAFVHIKAFTRRGPRPVDGQLVTYELAVDGKGRARAENVAFVEARGSRVLAPAAERSQGSGWLLLVGLFLLLLVALVFAGRLPGKVLALYCGASLLAFALYAWDKSAAVGGHWRTQESTLHMIALFCGWPGALLAQQVLRHKSRKRAFQVVFWITVGLNCALLGWYLTPGGSMALRHLLPMA